MHLRLIVSPDFQFFNAICRFLIILVLFVTLDFKTDLRVLHQLPAMLQHKLFSMHACTLSTCFEERMNFKLRTFMLACVFVYVFLCICKSSSFSLLLLMIYTKVDFQQLKEGQLVSPKSKIFRTVPILVASVWSALRSKHGHAVAVKWSSTVICQYSTVLQSLTFCTNEAGSSVMVSSKLSSVNHQFLSCFHFLLYIWGILQDEQLSWLTDNILAESRCRLSKS